MSELPSDVISVLLFLEELCKVAGVPREDVEAVIPNYIFDQFRHVMA